MKFKREIDYTKYNSNYETAGAADPILVFTLCMTTMCGLMMISGRHVDDKDYMSYTEMEQIEEQSMPVTYFEDSSYIFDILENDLSNKNQSNIKKLILK